MDKDAAMAKRAKLSLDNMKARKGAAAVAAKPAAAGEGKDKPVFFRVSLEAWTQLKRLSFDQGTTMNDMMRQATNELFERHKLPPIA